MCSTTTTAAVPTATGSTTRLVSNAQEPTWATGCAFANAGTRAVTICDDSDDSGNFRGVGIHEDTDGELVLITECSAGWYRYITGWRFNPSGILKPRFLYGYTDSSCVCYGRLHNGYWRLHFALDGLGGLVVEETDSPRGARRENWQPIRIEARRLRWPNRPMRWRVRKLSTGFTAEIVPSAKDGFHERSTTGEGDVWVVKARSTEMIGKQWLVRQYHTVCERRTHAERRPRRLVRGASAQARRGYLRMPAAGTRHLPQRVARSRRGLAPSPPTPLPRSGRGARLYAHF
jgi:hypothetical protein